MKKRKFSPAQLAAQKRFAAMAKAGTLKRKKRNTTIIKAKKISHLDVSRVHNPLASAKKRPIAKKRNAEHRDAQHPIHVRDYWQGRRGYKSQWQRAHEAGQRQLFGVKNPALLKRLETASKKAHATWTAAKAKYKTGSVQEVAAYNRFAKAFNKFNAYVDKKMVRPGWTVAEKLPTRKANPASKKRNSSSQAYRGYLITHNAIHGVWFISSGGVHVGSANSLAAAKKIIDELTGKQNPRRGTRKLEGAHRRYERQQKDLATVGLVPKSAPYSAAGRKLRKQYVLVMTRFDRTAQAVNEAAKLYGKDSKQFETAEKKNELARRQYDKLSAKYLAWELGKKNPRRGLRVAGQSIKRKREELKALGYTPAEITAALAAEKAKLAKRFGSFKKGTTEFRKQLEIARRVRARVNGKRLVSAVARRHNGANTSLARKRREEFVGRPSTQTKTLYAPAGSGASGTLAQLGKLHKLHIKGGKTYNFKGVPTLAQHPKTDQLFVLGKNYTVNAPKKNPGDRMVDLGEVKTIEYEAVKTHLGDTKPVRYYHHFGEEGGERPHALVNEEGLIIFSGGDYYIRPEGIRD